MSGAGPLVGPPASRRLRSPWGLELEEGDGLLDEELLGEALLGEALLVEESLVDELPGEALLGSGLLWVLLVVV
jgi:hypothetical protein